VIAPDARGFGDSPWAPEYSNDLFVGDLQDFLHKLRVHRPILCGNSFGATLAFMYAGLHNTEVERLIVIDTGPGLKPGAAPPPGVRPAGPVPIPPGPFDSPEAAESAAAAVLPPFMAAAFAREMRAANLRRTADGKWTWKYDREGTAAAAAGAATDPRKWPAWEAVTCPTLVLRGELSPAFPAEAAQQMVSGRSNVELRVIAGAGHFISLDAPQALELEIKKWLSI
jgi:pimeloyl-ACP methyl ester carboxylesterase